MKSFNFRKSVAILVAMLLFWCLFPELSRATNTSQYQTIVYQTPLPARVETGIYEGSTRIVQADIACLMTNTTYYIDVWPVSACEKNLNIIKPKLNTYLSQTERPVREIAMAEHVPRRYLRE